MKEEMNAFEKNNTWEIVDKPKAKNIAHCKWILSTRQMDPLKDTKQGWLPKGYTHGHGLDY